MNRVKIFKNSILNLLIVTRSQVAVGLYLFISLAIIIYGFILTEISLIRGLLLVLTGLVLFTLIEYLVHRFAYHSDEDYLENKNWQYLVHGVHHAHPKVHHLLALPIPLALFLNALFFVAFWLVLKEFSFFIFPGFMAGYAFQLLIHYYVHTRRPPNNIFRIWWRHHLMHHYSSEKKAFGVTSPFWDMVFGTMPDKKVVKK